MATFGTLKTAVYEELGYTAATVGTVETRLVRRAEVLLGMYHRVNQQYYASKIHLVSKAYAITTSAIASVSGNSLTISDSGVTDLQLTGAILEYNSTRNIVVSSTSRVCTMQKPVVWSNADVVTIYSRAFSVTPAIKQLHRISPVIDGNDSEVAYCERFEPDEFWRLDGLEQDVPDMYPSIVTLDPTTKYVLTDLYFRSTDTWSIALTYLRDVTRRNDDTTVLDIPDIAFNPLVLATAEYIKMTRGKGDHYLDTLINHFLQAR